MLTNLLKDLGEIGVAIGEYTIFSTNLDKKKIFFLVERKLISPLLLVKKRPKIGFRWGRRYENKPGCHRENRRGIHRREALHFQNEKRSEEFGAEMPGFRSFSNGFQQKGFRVRKGFSGVPVAYLAARGSNEIPSGIHEGSGKQKTHFGGRGGCAKGRMRQNESS